MRLEIDATRRLSFDDGSPVRAASAIVAYADGWLIAQDDSTLGAHWCSGSVAALRLLDPVDGKDSFSSEEGTKDLKPDLESACVLPDDSVAILGSGSTPARRRGVLLSGDGRRVVDLATLHERIRAALAVPQEILNLEGACVVGDHLRWFHRGLPAAGWPSASVDLPLDVPLTEAEPTQVRRYDLGSVDGVGLAVTDAVALTGGRVLVSTAAEDSPNSYDDGPVVGSALVLLDGDVVVDKIELPRVGGRIAKVEGLAVIDERASGARLMATIDADDHDSPSPVVELTLHW